MSEKRSRGDRFDGKWLRDIDSMHAIMPYLYPNRADNEAFITERVDLTHANEYLAQKNAANPADKYTLFHLMVAAIVKTITLRPQMNRFVKGGRMYQRNHLSIAFVVKKQFSDEAHEALAFLTFDGQATMDTVHEQIMREVHTCRGAQKDNSTSVMDRLVRLPRPILRMIMGLLHKLDYYGKVPYDLIKTDPNHATVFLSNLGSIRLKAGYHHLTNWGTNSVFVVLGEKKIAPVYDADGTLHMHEVMDIGITLDERIADGYYYSGTVKLLKALLDRPELLDRPAMEMVDDV